MTDRMISTESLHELSGATFATLQRACDDLRAVCDAVESIDSRLSFEKSSSLFWKAAALRMQFNGALVAVASLGAAASSYEQMGHVVDHSRLLPQVSAPPLAKRAKKAKARKR